ncbi:MAG: DUF2177 family protein [Candidatus Pacebacteria bacterium]|nr:DUF2177 family protein [Candidatus Paceibacterota bacterium]
MIEIIKIYIASVLVMAGLDAFWLGYVVKSFNLKHLGYLMGESVIWWPVILFYLVYAIALSVFAITPAIASHSAWTAIWRGAILGLAAYGAYDLTNNATIMKWPSIVTLTDMSWGIFVTALTSIIIYFLFR